VCGETGDRENLVVVLKHTRLTVFGNYVEHYHENTESIAPQARFILAVLSAMVQP